MFEEINNLKNDIKKTVEDIKEVKLENVIVDIKKDCDDVKEIKEEIKKYEVKE